MDSAEVTARSGATLKKDESNPRDWRTTPRASSLIAAKPATAVLRRQAADIGPKFCCSAQHGAFAKSCLLSRRHDKVASKSMLLGEALVYCVYRPTVLHNLLSLGSRGSLALPLPSTSSN